MILITGANGFLGQAVAKSFKEEAVCLSRTIPVHKPARHITFDLSGKGKIGELAKQLRDYDITQIIHTAAITPWARNPDFSLDLRIAETITNLSNQLELRQLYFLSGWIVYDMNGSPPFTEATALRPASPYGQSKLAVEDYFKGSLESTQLINLRLASVYGPGQTTKGLIPNLTKAALEDGELSLQAAETRRDYLYVDDLLGVLHKLTNLRLEGDLDLNIGSGTSVSVDTVAETIQQICEKLYGKEVRLVHAKDMKESAPLDNRLDIQKAKVFGLLDSPVSLYEGLEQYIKWAKHENIF